MKVLIVGSGAREHALAWKMKASEAVSDIYLWPGAPAMSGTGQKLPYDGNSWDDLAKFAKGFGIDFTVIGPEQPLAEGFADSCREYGLPAFGPQKAAAQLESSKEFAKLQMAEANIPTAGFEVVNDFVSCRKLACEMLARSGGTVIKASGLAAGKGVFVCQTEDDIQQGVDRLEKSMAQAAERIVIEEVLEGRECSFFCFIGEGGATPLGFAVDFKRLKDGDQGPNTGGMGCYTPVPWLPADAESQVMERVVDPLLEQLSKQDINYVGCLYVGLMWHPVKGPQVVEFNVRLGDPEAQVLAVNDQRDWGKMIAQKLGLMAQEEHSLEPAKTCAVAVVMAAQGYPYDKPTAKVSAFSPELFANESKNRAVFGASVVKDQGELKPGSGRVITLVQSASTFADARSGAYESLKEVASTWPEVQYRRDIAQRVNQEL